MNNLNKCIMVILISIILYSIGVSSNSFNLLREPMENHNLKLQSYVINMDKDNERYDNFMNSYMNSDVSKKPILRFSGVVGKTEKPDNFLTTESLNELKKIEKRGYRTYHHSLTRGGLGCFLSHSNLAKQLLSDTTNDAYLIFEDDTTILPFTYNKITDALNNLPDDWDMVLFYTIRAVGRKSNNYFNKLKSFWGMNCYIINKKGAKKIIDEVKLNKIDGQIDCYLSRMIQQDKLNVYSSKIHYVSCNSKDTNIQTLLKPIKGIDPYDFKGYKM